MKYSDKADRNQNAVSNHESADPIKDLAKMILLQNRKRKQFMQQLDWGEPGWDLLLDLFVAESERMDSSATALAERNNMPLSSVRRYLALLVERGLLTQASANEPNWRLTQTAKHGLVSWVRDAIGSMANHR
ncbi:IclR helix-turn-helix domain-containing protein [Parasphingorhabdus marina DSM 22363]|uniref:IclR helix-turn-helix domain-containing protein n=1 Tax=Parasphingorhabdus marina DSM 22363 TaxID=1123272 RepID=A0A1N6CXS3_9SPHN|nr:helix-turn-helix domain-containing protein [Parasphingorhabdus marina]SIN63361.1 IclR helix-turn-helix domain-containing protein [Parasphingorhabdus marina DSM 22363]